MILLLSLSFPFVQIVKLSLLQSLSGNFISLNRVLIFFYPRSVGPSRTLASGSSPSFCRSTGARSSAPGWTGCDSPPGSPGASWSRWGSPGPRMRRASRGRSKSTSTEENAITVMMEKKWKWGESSDARVK